MTTQRKFAFKEIVPRAMADFAVIHAAAFIAFALSIIYQTQTTDIPAAVLVSDFRRYYFSSFTLLSPLFPLVFYLNGLYTHVRYRPVATKFRRFALTLCLAVAVFITAYILLYGDHPISRSMALSFAVLGLGGLTLIRVVKEWLVRGWEYASETKNPEAADDLVVVIGGAGYIGSWLVRRLLEEGRRVRVLDNGTYGTEPIEPLLTNARLEYVKGDCRNIQDVVGVLRGASSVVHLAAIVGDPACELDRQTSIDINYSSTRMMVEIAKGYGVKRFLFASSCSVYGATDELMDEDSPVKPISLYGETKVASEQALLEAGGNGFYPVVMRFATVFGLSTRPRFDLVVNLLTAKAKQDGIITIFNGEQWRPFIHVKDIAEAVILLLKADLNTVGGQVFNIGDNRLNHTLAELGATIQRVFPRTSVKAVANEDCRNYKVSFSRIEKALSFRCKYTLEDGVREIKQAFDMGEITSYQDVRYSNAVFLRDAGTPGNRTRIDAQIMAAFGGERFGAGERSRAAAGGRG